MADPTANKSGRYLYVVKSGPGNGACGLFGIDGGQVYTIRAGPVCAVISDVPNKKIRPERRHLAAHQEVMKRLMAESTVLPMRFGIIANGDKAIRQILSRNRTALLEQLHRVAGKVEMGVRVRWDVPNIFEHFVGIHPGLMLARDRLLGARRDPTQEEKIELGRMFERMLNEDREAHAEKVEKVLSRYCFEIKQDLCRDEREVMNLACLVGREGQSLFETGVFEAAGLFDSSFAFDYNGPWAPHNFVEIDLKL